MNEDQGLMFWIGKLTKKSEHKIVELGVLEDERVEEEFEDEEYEELQ